MDNIFKENLRIKNIYIFFVTLYSYRCTSVFVEPICNKQKIEIGIGIGIEKNVLKKYIVFETFIFFPSDLYTYDYLYTINIIKKLQRIFHQVSIMTNI